LKSPIGGFTGSAVSTATWASIVQTAIEAKKQTRLSATFLNALKPRLKTAFGGIVYAGTGAPQSDPLADKKGKGNDNAVLNEERQILEEAGVTVPAGKTVDETYQQNYKTQFALAIEVYDAMRNFLVDNVLLDTAAHWDKKKHGWDGEDSPIPEGKYFFINANGTRMRTNDWFKYQDYWATSDERARNKDRSPYDSLSSQALNEIAQFLLEQMANGEPYQIACGANRPAKPQQYWKAFGNQSSSFVNQVHASGARDDLVLSDYALNDGFVSDPTLAAQPQSGTDAGGKKKSSLNYTVIGTLGYTFASKQCDLSGATCENPESFTVFADSYYGEDKYAPKTPTGKTGVIDRAGMGLDYAIRADWSPYNTSVSALFQLIPEFVSDTRFESKTFYAEARADLIDAPYLPCMGAGTIPIFDAIDLGCGFAGIVDYAHNFREGRQTVLHETFLRAGGEVGVTLVPDKNLCNAGFVCDYLINRLSTSAWYKVVEDTSQYHASLHNVNFKISLDIGGDDSKEKGLSITAKYTGGREDLTLYKLPKWNVGFSMSSF